LKIKWSIFPSINHPYMVEQGPKFKITSKGPTLYNEDSPSNKYTETTHKLENPDGETVVEVSLYHEPSYYAVGWEDGSITPNNFFSDVQNLVDAIKDRPDIYPLETKPLRGLLYGLEGKLIPVKQDVFEPLDELDQANKINFVNRPRERFVVL